MSRVIATLVLRIINYILDFFSPRRKLYRLKREVEDLKKEMLRAYKNHNQDLFNQLYSRLRWLRKQIRDLEELK